MSFFLHDPMITGKECQNYQPREEDSTHKNSKRCVNCGDEVEKHSKEVIREYYSPTKPKAPIDGATKFILLYDVIVFTIIWLLF